MVDDATPPELQIRIVQTPESKAAIEKLNREFARLCSPEYWAEQDWLRREMFGEEWERPEDCERP